MSDAEDPSFDDPKDPWHYAVQDKRDYITPEDIGSAIGAGAEKATLHAVVLEAISQGRVEDHSCCAFVAFQMKAT